MGSNSQYLKMEKRKKITWSNKKWQSCHIKEAWPFWHRSLRSLLQQAGKKPSQEIQAAKKRKLTGCRRWTSKCAQHWRNSAHWRQQPGPQHLQWFVQKGCRGSCSNKRIKASNEDWDTPASPLPVNLSQNSCLKMMQVWTSSVKKFYISTGTAMKMQGLFGVFFPSA